MVLSDRLTGIGVNEERMALFEYRGNAVHVYTVEGELLHMSEVFRRDEGRRVWDVGLDSCNFVYVADAPSYCIAIFTPEGQPTRHVHGFSPLSLSVSNNTLCVKSRRQYGEWHDALCVSTYRLLRN